MRRSECERERELKLIWSQAQEQKRIRTQAYIYLYKYIVGSHGQAGRTDQYFILASCLNDEANARERA